MHSYEVSMELSYWPNIDLNQALMNSKMKNNLELFSEILDNFLKSTFLESHNKSLLMKCKIKVEIQQKLYTSQK